MIRTWMAAAALALLLTANSGAAAGPTVLATFTVEGEARRVTQADLDFLAETHPELKAGLDEPEQRSTLIRELALQQLVPSPAGPAVDAGLLDLALRLQYARQLAPERLLRGPYWERYQNHVEPVARVSHILVYVRDREATRSQSEWEQAFAEAEVRAKAAAEAIRSGQRPFAGVAEEVSGAISKYNGGYMGYIALNHFRRLDPVFSDAIARLPLDTLSEPIRSPGLKGWHLLHVYDRREVRLDQLARLATELRDAHPAEQQIRALAQERLHGELRRRWLEDGRRLPPDATLERLRTVRAELFGDGEGGADPRRQMQDDFVWLWEAEARGLLDAGHYRRYAEQERRRLNKRSWEQQVMSGAPQPSEAEIRERYLKSRSTRPYSQVREAIAEELRPFVAYRHRRQAEARLLEAAGFRPVP